MKQERFKCETVECRKYNRTARVVMRYKGHEYRYCEYCNTKYLTHKEGDQIVIDNHWTPEKRTSYNTF